MGYLAKLLAASAVCALVQPAAVQAQETGSGDAQDTGIRMRDDLVLDAIVVTARRRAEDVQDVPLVVNTVTAEEFAELNIRDFTDVQQLVPGLQLGTNANSFGANAQIRGVNMDVNASGFNNTIEFYQNDAPILPQVVLQQTFDIAQVEVLRGPQGALRGRASPSGSMIVTTHKPDLYEIGGYVASTANDIGTINVNGALGMPVIEGVAGIRVAGIFAEDEVDRVTTINPTFDGRDPFARTKGGRITAVVQPTDWLRFEGGYQRIDRKRRNYDQAESFSLVSDELGDSPVLVTPGDRNAVAEDSRHSTEKYEIFNWQGQASFAGQSLIYVARASNRTSPASSHSTTAATSRALTTTSRPSGARSPPATRSASRTRRWSQGCSTTSSAPSSARRTRATPSSGMVRSRFPRCLVGASRRSRSRTSIRSPGPTRSRSSAT